MTAHAVSPPHAQRACTERRLSREDLRSSVDSCGETTVTVGSNCRYVNRHVHHCQSSFEMSPVFTRPMSPVRDLAGCAPTPAGPSETRDSSGAPRRHGASGGRDLGPSGACPSTLVRAADARGMMRGLERPATESRSTACAGRDTESRSGHARPPRLAPTMCNSLSATRRPFST